jgi:hypothetical protein
MNRSFRPWLRLAVWTSLCASSITLSSVQAPPGNEVVFIGAHHALSFLHPGFSPAHLRALLSKIDPVAVLVEQPPDFRSQRGIPTFPQESYAAVTWAETRGKAVYGVNWQSAEFINSAPRAPAVLTDTDQLTRLYDEAQRQLVAKPPFSVYGWQARQAYGDPSNTLENLQRQLDVPEESTLTPEREDRISSHIRSVLANHPGERVALVFGSAHYATLKVRVERTKDVRVVTAERYLPIEQERVVAGWLPDDALMSVGTDLDSYFALAAPQTRNAQRTREALDRLTRDQPASVITRYLQARWRMFVFDFDGANALLQEIAQSKGRTEKRYQPDPRWNWPPFRTMEAKARFYLAATHDLSGRREAALREYRALLELADDELIVPGLPAPYGSRRVDLRPYLRSFLAIPYRGGSFEAFRMGKAVGP